MKKNQLTTTKSTAVILGKTKSLMNITKKILEGNNKGLVTTKVSQDITIIGDLLWEKKTQEKMSWNDAMEYAKNLRLGGYDDWRLPTTDELLEVVTRCGGVDTTYGDDYWSEIAGKNRANKIYQANYRTKGFGFIIYWSSDSIYSDTAGLVDFYNGYQSHLYKHTNLYVRCVRAGQ